MLNANIRLSSVAYDFPHRARMSEKQLYYLSGFYILLGRGWIWGREAQGRVGAAFTAAELSSSQFLSFASLCEDFSLSDRNEWKGS